MTRSICVTLYIISLSVKRIFMSWCYCVLSFYLIIYRKRLVDVKICLGFSAFNANNRFEIPGAQKRWVENNNFWLYVSIAVVRNQSNSVKASWRIVLKLSHSLYFQSEYMFDKSLSKYFKFDPKFGLKFFFPKVVVFIFYKPSCGLHLKD